MTNIYFNEHGEAFSSAFGDRYFNSDVGLNESRYVFLDGNNLPESAKDIFVVGESGFGSGLNFLALWEAALKSGAKFEFISFEAFPLSVEDMVKIHENFPQISHLAFQLHEVYNPHVEIFEHDFGQIKLKIIFKDALEALDEFGKIDAWFFDGFSPKLNPDMWSEEFFKKVSSTCKVGTTFATFTAASSVRKALINVGFSVQKAKGYGVKREMLRGVYSGVL